MRFAVIGDVHSNKFALESVLNDIDEKGVDFIVSTGDLVGYLPYPNEVIDMIRRNKILSIKGNHDQRIGESLPIDDMTIQNMSYEEIQKKASMGYTNWSITEENRQYLNMLPDQLKLMAGGLSLVIVHGSPNKNTEYLYNDQEILYDLSNSVTEDIVISGHTHLPYHTVINNKHFINAGSVGKPKGGDPRATYIIVSVEGEQVSSEIVQIDYDIDSMVEAISKNSMISNDLIKNLRLGK